MPGRRSHRHIWKSPRIRPPTSAARSGASQLVFLYSADWRPQKPSTPSKCAWKLTHVASFWHRFTLWPSGPVNLTLELHTLSALEHSWCLHRLFCEQLLGRCSIWRQELCVFQCRRPWGRLAWKVTSLRPHKVPERFPSFDSWKKNTANFVICLRKAWT